MWEFENKDNRDDNAVRDLSAAHLERMMMQIFICKNIARSINKKLRNQPVAAIYAVRVSINEANFLKTRE